MRATKIVTTIGPASEAPGVLERLVAAGMDVARINTAHSDLASLRARLEAIRAASQHDGGRVGVMLDLGGPKVRVGEMAPGTVLGPGARFDLVPGERTGDRTVASVTYEGLGTDVRSGDRILLDDGAIELRVVSASADRVETLVAVGGTLRSHKGVNVPGVRLSVDAITPKDLEDLAWGLDAGVDMVAQSFVRSADDVRRLRAAMGERRVPIVAKIEKHEAVDDLAAIIHEADAIMVARGDLGVETSPEQVPVLQRLIVSACLDAGRPVIVATQMLESMVSAVRPTRAEASDVANAVFEGADAVMLSAETAVGRYPLEAVETMARICVSAEGAQGVEPEQLSESGGAPATPGTSSAVDVTRAVSGAVGRLADELGVVAIVTATESGATARAVAARRPAVPILAITPDAVVARALSLVHGVHPRVIRPVSSIEEQAALAIDAALASGLAKPGDLIALTAGVAQNRPGTTDLIRVLHV